MNPKQAAIGTPVKALLGTRLGMTQLWDEAGRIVPITIVRVGTNVVAQIRTLETDGYSAAQLASGELKTRNVIKLLQGRFDKAGVAPHRRPAEIRTSDTAGYELGQELTADLFEAGQKVDVIDTSKGKGFAGAMKRHGFSGVSVSHGTHRNHRKPGSIGVCTMSSRVFHGLRIAGRMDKDRVTVLNLPVHAVNVGKGTILLAGTVPGNRDGAIVVRTVVKGA